MKLGFVTMPVTGHLNPMTALARKLQSRGRGCVYWPSRCRTHRSYGEFEFRTLLRKRVSIRVDGDSSACRFVILPIYLRTHNREIALRTLERIRPENEIDRFRGKNLARR